MSRNLGVSANNIGLYYFISYSNADQKRIAPIVQALSKYDIPIWYDGGLITGQNWAKEIADNIQNSEAMIMFLSRNTFENENTYVKKEYDIANIRKKKIYIIFLDNIEPEEIPNVFITWWIDIQNLQHLNICDYKTNDDLVLKLCYDLGYSLDAGEKVKRLKNKFNALSKDERDLIVSDYFAMLVKSENLQSKASFFAQIQILGLKGMEFIKTNNSPYVSFCLNAQNRIVISNTVFKAKSKLVFHTGLGDAEVLEIYRDDLLISTIGGICDICDDEKFTKFYYDDNNDLLFISYISTPLNEEQAYMKDKNYNPKDSISVIIIERPLQDFVCHCFKDILLIN